MLWFGFDVVKNVRLDNLGDVRNDEVATVVADVPNHDARKCCQRHLEFHCHWFAIQVDQQLLVNDETPVGADLQLRRLRL